MTRARDTFCSFCGTAYALPLVYPRKCANGACGAEVRANPVPVAVLLLPVAHEGRVGLLVVRRGIEPRRGMLALVGGFVEEHETWQVAAAREVREETSVVVEASRMDSFWYVSTEPRPNRVLLFATAAPVDGTKIPTLVPNAETAERGVIFGPQGIEDLFAFPLHVQAAKRWFAARGLEGAHGYSMI